MECTEAGFYQSIREPVEQATTMDPSAYRSTPFFETEQDRVFAKSWVCVGYTAQLREPGDTLVTHVAGQPIVLTRDKEGGLRAFYNVCRHRGSLLVEASGRRKELRCPYHSWSYGLDGTLVNTPLFKLGPSAQGSFCKADYGLLPVRVDTWGCFVFVCLAPEAADLATYLGDLPARYSGFPLDELVLVRRKEYRIAANWKLVAENFLEYYHLPWVHPELTTVTAIEMHQRNQGPGMYMSFFASPLAQGGTPIDTDYLAPMPNLGATEANSGYFPLVFPNVALFLMPHHVFALIMQPTGPGQTLEYGDLLVHPNVLGAADSDTKLDEIFAFYDMVNLQDVRAVERVQEGIQARAYRGGRMTFRFEEPLHRFQNMVADYMTLAPRIPVGDAPEADPPASGDRAHRGQGLPGGAPAYAAPPDGQA